MVPRAGTVDSSAGGPEVTSASSASTRSAISWETAEFGGGSSSPVQPGSRRRSSASVGSRSPGPMSPGRSRSLHGTHSGASSASGPGSSTASSTVTILAREARATVTAQRQPRYPSSLHAK
ncbi:hypothetical protein SVIOM342S_07141 [Streptomyces violaceorubidus]